jgi:outer membrane protein OmpA-like peptidoglycan-associated protein
MHMKLPSCIALLALTTLQAVAQDPCAVFVQAVARRDVIQAGALQAVGATARCKGRPYILALAEYMAATAQYETAALLTEALLPIPGDSAHHYLSQRIQWLNQVAAEPLPVHLAHPRYEGSHSAVGVAMVPPYGAVWVEALPATIYMPKRSPATTAFKLRTVQTPGTPAIQSQRTLDRMARKLATHGYHAVGTATTMPDGKVAITATQNPHFGVPKPTIVLFAASGRYIGEAPFCRKAETCLGPAYNPADGTLVYASDREGGCGGIDLWAIPYLEGKWGSPTNMGCRINSVWDDINPTLHGDSIFFASNRPDMGFGGFDLYASHTIHHQPVNLRSPINSWWDEWVYFRTDGPKDYFTSRRTGTTKPYTAELLDKKIFFSSIHGVIADTTLQAGAKVVLIDAQGYEVQRTTAAMDGSFTFTHVKGQESYTIDFPGAALSSGSSLALYNHEGTLLEEVTSGDGKSFRLELLAPLDYFMTQVANRDESKIAINLLGRYAPNKQDTLAEVTIVLQDFDGQTIATTRTDPEGYFAFNMVKPDVAYTLISEVQNPKSTVYIMNTRGDVIQTVKPGNAGEFVYVRIQSDEEIITFTNERNQKVRIKANEYFDLGVTYFERGSARLLPVAIPELDRLALVLLANPTLGLVLEGHTDAIGDNARNQWLSEQRIEAVINYLILSGVHASRMKGVGYGETRPINHCVDGVACSEAEHAVNRRTEARIIRIPYD